MTATSAHLTLRPDRCNQCGRCVEVCPYDAVRVGADYILIDWHACNHCCACVEVCDRNAICREVVPLRSAATIAVAPSDVGKVVVGSRAEAKVVRKAAEQAAKQAVKLGARGFDGATTAASAAKPVLRTSTGRPAGASTVSKVRQADVPVRVGDARWTLVDVGLVAAALLLTIVGKNAVLAIPSLALMPAAGRVAARAAILATYYAVQLGALAFLAGRHGSTLMRGFGLRAGDDAEEGEPQAERPSKIGSAGLILLLLVGVEVVAVGYGLAAQAIGWGQPLTPSADVVSVFGANVVGLVLSTVLVAVLAPIAEELAFRGVILVALGERWGMWPAIGVSTLLFAAYHLSAWLFAPMLVFGVALGWLTWTRRSLWPSIVLHVLYNGLAVAAAFLVPK
jgi:membrane protease YdiL (CAAX protease family)/NAD-dependent dihydropyrimidine dehydrogenase PreA subunit